MTHRHASSKHHIHTSLFDLYHMLKILTLGNHNGPVAGPQTSLNPYFLSWVNVKGPADVIYNKAPVHVRKETSLLPLAPRW